MAKKVGRKSMTPGIDNVRVLATLRTLSTQRFADWYSDDGDFGKFIQGDEDAPSKEQILKAIAEMFAMPVKKSG